MEIARAEILKSLGQKTDLALERESEKKSEIQVLESQMAAPKFWDDRENAQKVSSRLASCQNFLAKWKKFAAEIDEISGLLAIAENADLPQIDALISELQTQISAAELELLFAAEHDRANAILSINTGTGGQDAEDFSQILLRMYLRFCEKNNFSAKILDQSDSDVGLKSATLQISGQNAFGHLKSEHGVHRLIRLSPFNAKNLRQTSFSRVEVLPEIETDSEIVLEEKDLRIDVFRSSGSGGQSVNTTDSAVRITFLPLGISVTCQNEKSQLQNKNAALKVLRSRIAQIQQQQNAEKISDLRGDLVENSFGSQIRTYTLQPYKLVKDHRTGAESTDPDKVFAGEISGFVRAFLSG